MLGYLIYFDLILIGYNLPKERQVGLDSSKKISLCIAVDVNYNFRYDEPHLNNVFG